MRIVLVGADFEENLGVGMIAAVAQQRGHTVRVLPFNTPDQAGSLAKRVVHEAPDVVGLSIQFQHRAHEFLSFAQTLRALGYAGHLTCGGQFPSLGWAEVLAEGAVDSVVLHDGERAFGELLDALVAGAPIDGVAGLAVRGPDGVGRRTAERALLDDLDELPFPVRYRPHTRHVGIPFVPIMGGRGCWGACSYCSITSHYRDARAHGGGKTFRLRSPESVAEEMAALAKQAGGPCIFCFHDDNFLLPRPEDTLARLRAIRRGLDARGVGRVAFIGKCRPETLTPALAKSLRELGVIRLYVGVENASERGASHLGRGKQHLAIDAALAACRAAGIFTCYNLLVFEPGATLSDVEDNLAFITRHAAHPVNFCRAEPYHGTPLQLELARQGGLGGSYLGYDYRIDDDRTELLFRIAAAAFRERNFRPDGVANRTMGLGYNLKVLEHFYLQASADSRAEWARLVRRATSLTERITADTAEFLAQAIALARSADLSDRDAIERQSALLGLAIAASDAVWHRELDEVYAAFEDFARGARRKASLAVRLARGVAMGASLAVGTVTVACGGEATVDPVPADAGRDSFPADPLPFDAGRDAFVADPLPFDAGIDARDSASDAPKDAPSDVLIVDPAPIDSGRDARLDPRRLRLIDQFRDTSPRRARRSDDLPLSEPPEVVLSGRREDGAIVATLRGGPDALSLRWEGDGAVSGSGREVVWTPDDDGAALRVAVRSSHGVAVVSLRARSVT